MKKIKIVKENLDVIEKVLQEVNGNSAAHCITNYLQLLCFVEKLENRLQDFLKHKKYFKGAMGFIKSGSAMPKCYKGLRNVTGIIIERNTNDWFLVQVSKESLWPDQSGYCRLYMTETQSAIAIERFKAENYTVIL